jgi:mRNA interferase HicA
MEVKRDDLIRKINKAARQSDLKLELVREGGKHAIYRCGSQLVTVPRHREINEMTAIGIMADLEAELGKGWWKK